MTTKSKAAFLFTLCAAAVLLGSCQFSLRLWVLPGATSDNLVLGFAESRKQEEKVRPQSVQVYPCEALKNGDGVPTTEALWQASVPPGVTATPANRIAYGRDEHGLRTSRGPAPLAAGCYAVLAYGRDGRDALRAAGVRFEVRGDGRVVEK
jgi:hypothetical protein